MSFDEWAALWSGRAAVTLTALAAVAGMLLWVFGNRANAVKDAAFQRLQLETERQRERAARAEEELLVLKSRIAPRQLSEADRRRLVEALRAAAPKGSIKVTCVVGDGEGLAFATQIEETLREAGWPTDGVTQAIYGPGGNPIGFGIAVRSQEAIPRCAGPLQHAFSVAGINLPAAVDPTVGDGALHIIVGNKPR